MGGLPDPSRSSAPLEDGLVVVLRPLDPAAPWIAAWRDLGRRALVDNLFYEPDFALAAAEAYGAGVQAVLVCDRPPEDAGLRLLAVWPCRIVRRRWGVPLALGLGWMHDVGVFGAPLLDASAPDRALDALLRGAGRLVAPRLMLTHAPTEGAFADRLDAWCARHDARQARFWAHERAFLDLGSRPAPERADYLGHLSARERRRLRQARERLEAAGPLLHETIRDPAALRHAFDDYVALETRGWKGRAGTALGNAPAQAAFLRAAIAALGGRGRVRIDRLRRNGDTLASALTFATRGTVWCVKIAFDETEARNSPGAQLLHRLTENLVADPTVTAGDSCAPPGFRLAETFWAGRRSLAHVLIEARHDPLFPLAERLERARAWTSLAKERARARARELARTLRARRSDR